LTTRGGEKKIEREQAVLGNIEQCNQGNSEQDKYKKIIACSTKTCEDITMAIPVEVLARADVGNIVLKCKENRIVKEGEKPENVSKFEIIQEISAQIPIEFIAKVEVRDERVNFDVHGCK